MLPKDDPFRSEGRYQPQGKEHEDLYTSMILSIKNVWNERQTHWLGVLLWMRWMQLRFRYDPVSVVVEWNYSL